MMKECKGLASEHVTAIVTTCIIDLNVPTITGITAHADTRRTNPSIQIFWQKIFVELFALIPLNIKAPLCKITQ